jgi:hypothetical protein
MIRKKTRAPLTQRHFANGWAELDYLCKKIRYWLYTREQKPRARRYLDRLKRVLHDLPESEMAILGEEGLALFHELQGHIGEAITHRQREIRLMEQLQREAQSPGYTDSTKAYILRDRDTAELEERQAILAALRKTKAQQSDDVVRR